MLWTTGGSARGRALKSGAFLKPARGGRCERRDWAWLYALGSVHSVGFLGPMRPEQEKTAAGGTHLKVPVRVARSTVNHVSDMGRAPGSSGPSGGELPSPASPVPAAAAGGCAGWWQRCVLTWGRGAGQCLYQMPLDLPPGGARIRAEARFGTWSSI